MHPVFFRFFGLTIHWYGVMMALGFIAGMTSWRLLGRREGRTFAFCSDLLFWIMIGGILGARVASIAANFEFYRENPMEVFFLHRGGLVFYGGFLGAGLAIWIFARRHNEAVVRLLDFVVPSLPLGHFFGRIGCFMNGCCHGYPHDGPLGVCFPAKSPPWFYQFRVSRLVESYDLWAKPIHPVQLYESAGNLLLYVLLAWFYLRRKRDGQVVAAYLLIYPLIRFTTETFRGDERVYFGPLTVAQAVSVGLFAAGLFFLYYSTLGPAKSVTTEE